MRRLALLAMTVALGCNVADDGGASDHSRDGERTARVPAVSMEQAPEVVKTTKPPVATAPPSAPAAVKPPTVVSKAPLAVKPAAVVAAVVAEPPAVVAEPPAVVAEPPTPPAPAPEPEPEPDISTEEDFEAEAIRDITEATLEAELAELEKELE